MMDLRAEKYIHAEKRMIRDAVIWNTSSSAAEAGRRMGVSRQGATRRAHTIRIHGITLKDMGKRRGGSDFAKVERHALAALRKNQKGEPTGTGPEK